jgi:hypothetical protein
MKTLKTVLRLCLLGSCFLLTVFICINGWSAVDAPNVPANTNRQDSATTPQLRDPFTELRELERNATPGNLRAAFTNTAVYMRTGAIKIIKRRGDKKFLPELLRALEDERAEVRVEAALTLAAFGEPRGKFALVDEMTKARQAQVKLSSESAGRTFWDTHDLMAWSEGAGALADLGDSSGYDVLRTTMLNGNLGFRGLAVIQLPKFMRFKDKRAEVEHILLMEIDNAIEQIDKARLEHPDRRPAGEIGYFDVVSRLLAGIGGEQQAAKLRSYTQHKEPEVRRYAEAALRAMSRKGDRNQE